MGAGRCRILVSVEVGLVRGAVGFLGLILCCFVPTASCCWWLFILRLLLAVFSAFAAFAGFVGVAVLAALAILVALGDSTSDFLALGEAGCIGRADTELDFSTTAAVSPEDALTASVAVVDGVPSGRSASLVGIGWLCCSSKPTISRRLPASSTKGCQNKAVALRSGCVRGPAYPSLTARSNGVCLARSWMVGSAPRDTSRPTPALQPCHPAPARASEFLEHGSQQQRSTAVSCLLHSNMQWCPMIRGHEVGIGSRFKQRLQRVQGAHGARDVQRRFIPLVGSVEHGSDVELAVAADVLDDHIHQLRRSGLHARVV